MALLHTGHQAGVHSPYCLLEVERWSGGDAGEVASERCICIINVGQTGGTCAVTGLCLSGMSVLSVGR